MEQIVIQPKTAGTARIEAALDLDPKGLKRRRTRRRWFYLLVLSAAVAIAAGIYFWTVQPSTRITYTTAPGELTDITVEVSATGILQPLTQVEISSELSGVVRTVAVRENEHVIKGQMLAELDTTRLAAQVERAEASVNASQARVRDAETTLDEAERALARSTNLQSRGMLADQALEAATAARDRAHSAVASANADLAVANAELKLQQAELSKSVIYAPIDGIVLTRDVDPGQTVAASFSAPVLFVIAENLERMQLQAAIDEADIGAVAAGQRGRFTVDAFPDRPFQAEISDIAYASVTTEGVVTYEAKLAVDNGELLLRPGMTATVHIVTREAKGVLTVPNAAFRYRPAPAAEETRRGWSLQNLFMPRFRRSGSMRPTAASADGARTLYTLQDGAPVAVQVRTGATDGDRTEVLSGLEAGDVVITGSSEPRG
jgi:HlyD family secretion protein